MAKKTVFITGGTGNMGWAAVQEMLKKPSEINIKMLARKSPKNEEKLKGLMAKPNVKVVWGDLCDYGRRNRRRLCAAHRRYGISHR